MSNLADDLTAAKALIGEPDAWAKGDGGDEHLCWCASTACKQIATFIDADGATVDIARWQDMTDMLEYASMLQPLALVDYNDAPDTTHADIIALFDRAIAKATGEPS